MSSSPPSLHSQASNRRMLGKSANPVPSASANTTPDLNMGDGESLNHTLLAAAGALFNHMAANKKRGREADVGTKIKVNAKLAKPCEGKQAVNAQSQLAFTPGRAKRA